MRRVILNADDLGIHPSIDRGIRDAFVDGALTSATLLVTTPWTEDAVALAQACGLPMGVHLSLTLGTCAADPKQVTELVDESGRFRRPARELLFVGRTPGESTDAIAAAIRTELDAQLARARDLGVEPTHVDSHQHVHMNPMIHAIVEELVPRYGVKRVRWSREPFHRATLTEDGLANLRRRNPLKRAVLNRLARRITPRLAHPETFYGVGHSGNLGAGALRRYVATGRGATIEVGLHPGHSVAPGEGGYHDGSVNAFIESPWRTRELEALLQLKTDVPLISFAELGDD